MTVIIENSSDSILYYDALASEIKTSADFLQSRRKITGNDLDAYLENKLLNLRSPGTYRLITNAFAVPPKTRWSLSNNTYTYHSELHPRLTPKHATLETLERSALSYLKKYSTSPITVECSGGLDSSIIIEFLLRHGFNICLSGFTSDRYEFRTERKIQEYYFSKVKSSTSLSYESCGAFDDLKQAPLHPLPAQESLSHKRHQVAANATLALNSTLLLSGEAGDQLLGIRPNNIVKGVNIPAGYYYWSLAEKWSDQFIYNDKGVDYVSALAIGSLPRQILSMRSGLGEDHMKIWARDILKDKLPEMLTKYAYKAFHDGWVMDGLVSVLDDIAELGKTTYEYLGHPEIRPDILVADSLTYKSMPSDLKIRYLGRLAFATWIYSLARDNKLI
jgi:hypothetical protein